MTMKRFDYIFNYSKFNPASPKQKMELFSQNGVISPYITKTKTPSFGSKAMKFISQTRPDLEHLASLIINFQTASKMNSSYCIPYISRASVDGRVRGDFNLGGTVSWRLSSSNVNLQQTPASGSIFSKVFKDLVEAPDGKLLLSVDYSALQEVTQCNLIKDPNKVKLMTTKSDGVGYDVHSYHTLYYWKDKVEELMGVPADFSLEFNKEFVKAQKNNPTLKRLRDASKSISFALAFGAGPDMIASLLNPADKQQARSEAENIHRIYHTELYPETSKYGSKVTATTRLADYILKQYRPTEIYIGLGLSLHTDNRIKDARTIQNASIQFWDIITLLFMSMYDLPEGARFINEIHDALYLEIDGARVCDVVSKTESWSFATMIELINSTLIPLMLTPIFTEQLVNNSAVLAYGKTLASQTDLPPLAGIELQRFLQDKGF